MKRRAAIGLTLAAAVVPAAARAPARGGYRAILQVSDRDPARWRLALGNAANVQRDLGKDHVRLEILAYGPGIHMLVLESEVTPELAGALDSSVRLIACENTMISLGLKRADMYDGIDFVRTGVSHLIKRQREGWAYIRP